MIGTRRSLDEPLARPIPLSLLQTVNRRCGQRARATPILWRAGEKGRLARQSKWSARLDAGE
jgi:hypothetical protein